MVPAAPQAPSALGPPTAPQAASRLLLGLAVAFVALQVGASAWGPYGWFIDEFYYLACARRLAAGYVDHPPLSILVLVATEAALGASRVAVRLSASLAIAAAAVLTGLMARRLGGQRFAQGLAALCVIMAPAFLLVGSFYSMNALEVVLWSGLGLAAMHLLDQAAPRTWLLFGVLAGLALLNKHTAGLFVLALAGALLLSPARRHLRTPWPWLGATVAALLLLPNLIWQQRHGWPSLEFYRHAQALKNVPTPPLRALLNQVLLVGPSAMGVALCGLAFYLVVPAGRPYRPLGWAFAALLTLMVLSGSSRPDRLAAAYPLVLAAGAVGIERLARAGRAWLRGATVVAVAVPAVVLAPVVLPLLPPARVAAYTARLGAVPQIERGKTSPLPQWLADRTEWESFVRDMAEVYHSLPAADQARAVLYAPSYGQAGALEQLGRAQGLPPVISVHNSYWMWSQGDLDRDVLVAADADRRDLARLFQDVQVARVHRCTYCMSWRDQVPILVARGRRASLAASWPRLKKFE